MTGNHSEQKCDVSYLAAKWPDLVKRASEGDQSEARHSPIGRLQTHYATMSGRLADGASRVRSQCQRRLTSRDRRCRTATRTAGRAVEIPRIPRDLKSAVLGRRAHRELVHIGLAQEHSVGFLQSR